MLTKKYDDGNDYSYYRFKNYDNLSSVTIELKVGEMIFADARLVHAGGESMVGKTHYLPGSGQIKKKRTKGKDELHKCITHLSFHAYVGDKKNTEFENGNADTYPVEVDDNAFESSN